jgi:hypothetical protein
LFILSFTCFFFISYNYNTVIKMNIPPYQYSPESVPLTPDENDQIPTTPIPPPPTIILSPEIQNMINILLQNVKKIEYEIKLIKNINDVNTIYSKLNQFNNEFNNISLLTNNVITYDMAIIKTYINNYWFLLDQIRPVEIE